MHTLLGILISLVTALAAAIASLVSSAPAADSSVAAAPDEVAPRMYHATADPWDVTAPEPLARPELRPAFEVRTERTSVFPGLAPPPPPAPRGQTALVKPGRSMIVTVIVPRASQPVLQRCTVRIHDAQRDNASVVPGKLS